MALRVIALSLLLTGAAATNASNATTNATTTVFVSGTPAAPAPAPWRPLPPLPAAATPPPRRRPAAPRRPLPPRGRADRSSPPGRSRWRCCPSCSERRRRGPKRHIFAPRPSPTVLAGRPEASARGGLLTLRLFVMWVEPAGRAGQPPLVSLGASEPPASGDSRLSPAARDRGHTLPYRIAAVSGLTFNLISALLQVIKFGLMCSILHHYHIISISLGTMGHGDHKGLPPPPPRTEVLYVHTHRCLNVGGGGVLCGPGVFVGFRTTKRVSEPRRDAAPPSVCACGRLQFSQADRISAAARLPGRRPRSRL